MSANTLLQAFTRLGHTQQLQLLADMWDQVAENNQPPKLTSAQKKELTSRKKLYQAGQSKGRPWAAVKASLLKADGR